MGGGERSRALHVLLGKQREKPFLAIALDFIFSKC